MTTRVLRHTAACWLALASVIALADADAPDLEFLEYLGSWEESDEDWLLFDDDDAEASANEEAVPTDGAPEIERSTEQDNGR